MTHAIRRLGPLILLLLATLLTAATAHAADDFLSVDDAFAPSVERVDANHIAVRWHIADAYYLYRHAFGFELEKAGDTTLGEPRIPDGDQHTDEFFGSVETYRDTVRVVLPLSRSDALTDGARIAVQYQGCADAGLCYPPQNREFTIPAAAGDTGDTGDTGESSSASAANGNSNGFVTQQDDLARRLADAGHLSTLGLFFVLGILLAFTPCILPMIPILSGLIVGSGAGPRRAFGLSLVYVLAMAVAYAVFGVIAGYFGANLQAALQMPVVLLPFAAIFVALALASFGLFELQVPTSWQTRLGAIGSRRGGLAGAALMGFFAALIAGPCLAPPLVGALLYISSSGDFLLGGAALFVLGLGMGLPLILMGTFGARFVPRAGAWMQQIRIFFGVVLLGVALWLVSRILDPVTALAGWGLLTLAYGAYLSSRITESTALLAFKRAVVFVLFFYAGCAGVGVLAGNGRPTQPLAVLAQSGSSPTQSASTEAVFTQVEDYDQLQAALQAAAKADRPAVVDFYADWCVECVQMERTVFANNDVRNALDDVAALQIDITDYDATDRALLRKLDVFGPPTMLFYRPDGEEAADHRIIGKVDAAGFIRRLQRATATTDASG